MNIAFGNRIWSERSEFGHVEYGVDVHCPWEFELEGGVGDDLVNGIRSEPFISKFLHGLVSMDIVCLKPHFVTDRVFWSLGCMIVMEACHAISSLVEGRFGFFLRFLDPG